MVTDNATIALLGATRGIGRLVLERALDRGYRVRALVRPGSTLDVAHPNLTVVRGDATNADDVVRALAGAEALLSAVGAPPRASIATRTETAKASIEAMERTGVRRLIAVSVYGVGETKSHLPFFTRAVVLPLFLRRVIADHETQEQAIRASDLDWTLLRPPYLTDGAATGDYVSNFGDDTDGLTWKISREDVAHCMIESLERGAHVRTAFGLSYRQASASAA